MIGAVGGQDSLLTDTLQIVNVLGGRETCNVVEIAVEMAVVGEAILAEQGVERLLAGTYHGIGGQAEAQDALELLGIHANVVGKHPPELTLTEAGGRCQLLHAHCGIAHQRVQHMGQGLRVG